MTSHTELKYAKNILETIGRTPLVRLNRVAAGVKATVLAKVEFFNPGGSVKDRIGVCMIEDAVRNGMLKPGGTVVECTSGNTGAGLAIAAAVMGYKAIFTMPDKMSKEKVRLLKAYGAEVVTCPTNVPPDSEESYYSVAKRIVETTPNAVLANQYYNPVNPLAHYLTTGPEIWEDSGGRVDYFVAGIGTGGTISGIAKFLKEKKPSVKIIGVDPEGSILKDFFYTKKMGEARPYLVEGIGEDIVPGTFEYQYVDEVITVTDRQSFQMARRLSREEGLMVGGSCGTAVHAALQVAKGLTADKVVVVLLPDTGERYLSKFHSDEWMRENRMLDAQPLTVGDLVRSKAARMPALVHVTAEDTVEKAIELMKRYNISQMPVSEGDRWVGRLTEGKLLDELLEGKVSPERRVDTIMEEPFPELDPKADCAQALELFSRHHDAIIVKGEDGATGILTKYDLVDYTLSGRL